MAQYERLNLPDPLSQVSIQFRTYDAGIVTPLGASEAIVTYQGRRSKERFYVVPDSFPPILRRAWIRHLNTNLKELDKKKEAPVPEVGAIQVETIDELAKQFPRVFEQSVCKIPGIKCSLQLRQNSKPMFIKPREIPYAIREGVELELEELQKNGIITPVERSDWGSSLVPVPKADGKIRLCVDYKVTVNPQLTESHYPIPRIEELIQKVKKSNYYCKLDLFKAYLHVEMDEESSQIQTISMQKGTYRMKSQFW